MNEDHNIHVPGPSVWPIVLAGSFVLIAIGLVSSITVSIVGILVLLAAIGGWAMENRAREETDHE